MKSIIELYDKGVLTEQHALYDIFENTTEADLREMPCLWTDKLRQLVDSMPTTDEGWQRYFIVQSWCGRGMPPTMEERRDFARQRTKFLRAYFDDSL